MQVVVLRRPGVHDIPAWALKSPVATILGIATNNDGYTKESITFPSSDAQTDLARQVSFAPLGNQSCPFSLLSGLNALTRCMTGQVLLESGVSSSDITYVEAHGTGTVAGMASKPG